MPNVNKQAWPHLAHIWPTFGLMIENQLKKYKNGRIQMLPIMFHMLVGIMTVPMRYLS